MAPNNRPRLSPFRAGLVAALLTGTVAVGVTAGGGMSVSASLPAAAHRVAAAPTHPPVVVAHSLAVASAAPDQLPTPAPTAASTPAPAAAPADPVAAPAATATRVAPARVAPAPRPAAPRPVAPRPPAPAPRPAAGHRNYLTSGDGTLNTGVGTYSDCSGRTSLTRVSAAIDTCIGGRTYFVGHNPGVFTPLMHMGVGSIITFWDNNGNAHNMQVIAVRAWYSRNGVPGLIGSVEFQTCITADGSLDRILDAVYI